MATGGDGRSDLDRVFGRSHAGADAGRESAAASPDALNPSLRALVSQFEALSREVQQLAGGLSDRQFQWRPGAGRWSVADCVGHLNIVGSELLPAVDAAIAEARSRALYANGPFHPGLVARRLLRATEPPVRLPARARERHVPTSDPAVRDAVPALLDLLDQLGSRVRKSNGLDLRQIKAPAPGWRFLRVNVFELLLLFAAHGRRHFAQVRDVRRRSDFPSGQAAPDPQRSGGAPRQAR